MKIGIIYFATGRYICFWKEFYETAKKFLFLNHDVTYYVLTDNDDFDYKNEDDVKTFYYPKLGWPEVTLLKFEAFLGIKEELLKQDYIYHFNANMKFIAEIGDEIIPNESQGYIALCEWASHYNDKDNLDFPYDRNPECYAYIKEGEGKHYFMGGVHGGRSDKYLEMCDFMNAKIREDYAKGIIARFHDESVINKYALDKNPLIMSPEYAMPEKWKIKGCKNIKGVLLKKHHYKYGGHAYLRGETDKKITKFKWFLNKIFGTHFI